MSLYEDFIRSYYKDMPKTLEFLLRRRNEERSALINHVKDMNKPSYGEQDGNQRVSPKPTNGPGASTEQPRH
jgi:hypothetical protein